jgi:hypothetical protein
MNPVISPEMADGAIQIFVYFVTALTALLSLVLTGRA